MEAYISIAICDILPYAPKEVGVLNEFGKTPNKLCSPIIFGTDLLASQEPFTLIEEIDKLNPTTLWNCISEYTSYEKPWLEHLQQCSIRDPPQ